MRGADADTFAPASSPSSEPYNSDPYYGTLGTPSTLTIPGGRNSSASWTDKNGNFWLFGGDGLDGSPALYEGLLNDLWEYSPATNEWTWMGGSSSVSSACANNPYGPGYCGQSGIYGTEGTASATNIPGGRKLSVTWIDSAGNFWLFGGYGIDSIGALGYLNDLWEFNPTTNEWTWISGSATVGSNPSGQPGVYGTQGVPAAGNVPQGLYSAMGWIDSNNNLWLFGGIGIASPLGGQGYLFNNLWEFNPSTKEWAWISGSGGSETASDANYGTLGVASPDNEPPARRSATTWTDSNGDWWMFGGYVDDAVSNNDLNDLWEFDPSTKQWTWQGGVSVPPLNAYGNSTPPTGSYGTLGIAAASNIPGARESASAWADDAGNLWLFGGQGVDSTGFVGYGPLNDLWKYNLASKQWTWVSGSNLSYQGGVYGVRGTAATGNIPGARYSSATWLDKSGNLWIFAGWGILDGATGGSTTLNDLWRYQP